MARQKTLWNYKEFAWKICISWENCEGAQKRNWICKIQGKYRRSTRYAINKATKHKATKRNRIRGKLKGTNTKYKIRKKKQNPSTKAHTHCDKKKKFILCFKLKKLLSGSCLHRTRLSQESHNITWSVLQCYKKWREKTEEISAFAHHSSTCNSINSSITITITINNNTEQQPSSRKNRAEQYQNRHNNSECLNNIWNWIERPSDAQVQKERE